MKDRDPHNLRLMGDTLRTEIRLQHNMMVSHVGAFKLALERLGINGCGMIVIMRPSNL